MNGLIGDTLVFLIALPLAVTVTGALVSALDHRPFRQEPDAVAALRRAIGWLSALFVFLLLLPAGRRGLIGWAWLVVALLHGAAFLIPRLVLAAGWTVELRLDDEPAAQSDDLSDGCSPGAQATDDRREPP